MISLHCKNTPLLFCIILFINGIYFVEFISTDDRKKRETLSFEIQFQLLINNNINCSDIVIEHYYKNWNSQSKEIILLLFVEHSILLR